MNMATYETFAAVYDAVMDDSLYDLWTDFSSGIFLKVRIGKITGIGLWDRDPVCSFSQAGFDVTGLDLSADMLKIAEKRAASAKQKIDFIEGNMLDLSQAGTYDFVTCYSDSICYMQDEVEVGDVFREVYNALNEDGVLSLMSTQPTRQMRSSQAILIMKMRKTLPCFGIPTRMKPSPDRP